MKLIRNFIAIVLILVILAGCVSQRKFYAVQAQAQEQFKIIEALKEDSLSLFKSLKFLDAQNFDLAEENKRLKLIIEKQGNTTSIEKLYTVVPVMPVPPPQPTDYTILQLRSLSNLKNYSQIDSIISHSFQLSNYDKTYLAVENGGFAIATDIEEIDENGKLVKKSLQNSSSGFANALIKKFKDVFLSKTGYYRCIVVVVSPNLYQLGGVKVSYDELMSWLNTKTIKLPDDIGKKTFAKPPQVVALLYEFEQNENTDNRAQIIGRAMSKTKLSDHPIIKNLSNGN